MQISKYYFYASASKFQRSIASSDSIEWLIICFIKIVPITFSHSRSVKVKFSLMAFQLKYPIATLCSTGIDGEDQGKLAFFRESSNLSSSLTITVCRQRLVEIKPGFSPSQFWHQNYVSGMNIYRDFYITNWLNDPVCMFKESYSIGFVEVSSRISLCVFYQVIELISYPSSPIVFLPSQQVLACSLDQSRCGFCGCYRSLPAILNGKKPNKRGYVLRPGHPLVEPRMYCNILGAVYDALNLTW